MRAAWDWAFSREGETEKRDLIEFVVDLGFDTLIVSDPSPMLVDFAHDHGVCVLDIVHPFPDESFENDHPECLQRLHPLEKRFATAIEETDTAGYNRLAFRWYPLVHTRSFLCFNHPESLRFLERKIESSLAVADGIAFDGFGYRNHYACFCDRCQEERSKRSDDMASGNPTLETQRRQAEELLIDTSRRLYGIMQSIDSDAIATNHVWPPFRPNRTYGARLRLDYCSQTISWFYRPTWSLERVEFEASLHASLETDENTFVPFIGAYSNPQQRRSAERIREELAIASTYGDGTLVFCTLEAPRDDPDVADAIRAFNAVAD